MAKKGAGKLVIKGGSAALKTPGAKGAGKVASKVTGMKVGGCKK